MKNIRYIWLGIVLFAGFVAGTGALYAQTTTLDVAIKSSAEEIEAGLSRGIKVAVLNLNSTSARFSDYVIDELMTALVRSGKVTVVDRANLEAIRGEMNFQMSGEVSDASAQRIGEMLGAQSIILGRVQDMGSYLVIRFRAIAVETAALQAMSVANVQKDRQVTTLMGPGTAISADGLTYSTGRKVSTGFLNMLLGTGSFMMGDSDGGFLVGGIELAGVALIVIGAVSTPRKPTQSSFGSNWWTYKDNGGYSETEAQEEYQKDQDLSTALIIAGAGVYAAGAVVGFIRPFAYDRSLARKAGFASADNPMNNISIVPVYNRNGSGATVLYSMSF